MKKLLTVLILVIFGLSGLLLLSACTRVSQPLPTQPPAAATATPPPVSTTTAHGLTVRFAAERSQYTLGEPVLITVTAHNRTTEPIVIYDGFDLLDGLIGVQVMAEGDEFRYYSGPFPVLNILYLSATKFVWCRRIV